MRDRCQRDVEQGFPGCAASDRVGGFDEIIERGRMESKRKIVVGACCVASLLAVVGMKAGTAEDPGRKEIEAFNKRYVELHLKMDTAGILALWAEDGVDLMPGDAAMIGKKKIVAWVEDIVAKMPGYKVTKQEMEFHDIHVCGEWASEWATEHQVVQPPDGKPVIDSYGKMALVLHREANGEWKVQQEMWNAAPKP
jgi:uncharacterized protein (TIGR02246 family)